MAEVLLLRPIVVLAAITSKFGCGFARELGVVGSWFGCGLVVVWSWFGCGFARGLCVVFVCPFLL